VPGVAKRRRKSSGKVGGFESTVGGGALPLDVGRRLSMTGEVGRAIISYLGLSKGETSFKKIKHTRNISSTSISSWTFKKGFQSRDGNGCSSRTIDR